MNIYKKKLIKILIQTILNIISKFFSIPMK